MAPIPIPSPPLIATDLEVKQKEPPSTLLGIPIVEETREGEDQHVCASRETITQEGTCSILAVALNLVNTTVGAGIIGLPFAIRQAGFGFGVLMTVLVAYLTNLSLVLMVYVGERAGVQSFCGLLESSLGAVGFWLVNSVVLVNGVGTMVSYVIIIGDTLPVVAGTYAPAWTWLAHRELVIMASCLCFVLPLLFWRNVGKLARVSAIGVLCPPVILFAVAYRAFVEPAYAREHSVEFTFFGPSVFSAIGVMAFAFVSNQTAFLNYRELKDRSLRRWTWSTLVAIHLSLVISLGLAILGYVAFGTDVQDNILSSFPPHDPYINLARFVLAVSMFFTFPMQFYPARVALHRMFRWETESLRATRIQHVGVTLVLFAGIVAIGLAVHALGDVYALVGSVCSNLIAYLLPGMATIAILLKTKTTAVSRRGLGRLDEEEVESLLRHSSKFPQNNSDAPPWFVLPVVCALILCGGFFLVAGTGSTILKMVS